MGMTRRGFIRGAAAAAAGSMLAATVTEAAYATDGANATAASASEAGGAYETGSEATWDKEADIVVVGGGTGQFAAVAAVQKGMSVILLEKSNDLGGAMKYSGGCFWLPNSEFAQEQGDTREIAKTYLDHMQMGIGREEIEDAFLDNTQGVVDVLRAAGLNVQPLMRNSAYHPNWDGGSIVGRSCQIMDGGAEGTTDTSANGGFRLGQALLSAIEASGSEVLYETPAQHLIVTRTDADAAPEVVGVLATDKDGNEIRIRADKGVILATGGFEWNEDYAATYLRVPIAHGAALSLPTNVGDGLRMAQEVGSGMSLLNQCFGMTFFKAHAEYAVEHQSIVCQAGNMQSGMTGSVIVDLTGRRFMREDGDYAGKANAFGGYMNFLDEGYSCDPAWWICDDECYTQYDGVCGFTRDFGYPVPDDLPDEDFVFTADTIEELAGMIGLDPEILAESIEEFNKFAEDGKDLLFHRGECGWGGFPDGNAFRGLTEPPFHAAAMVAGAVGTMGGPKLNGNAQVLHANGDPIKGLYAMGNCAGVGAPGPSYGSEGGTIGPAFVMGLVAVNSIANL